MTYTDEEIRKVSRDKDMLWYSARRLYRMGMRPVIILGTVRASLGLTREEVAKMFTELANGTTSTTSKGGGES